MTPSPAARRATAVTLLGALLCALASALAFWLGWFAYPDRLLLDEQAGILRRVAPRPLADDVVLVGIDEAFLRGVDEPAALMHAHLGAVFRGLAQFRPRLVGLDIVLPEKSFSFLAPVDNPQLDFDRELAKGLLVLGASSPVIVARTGDRDLRKFRDIHPAFVAASGQWRQSYAGPLPAGFDQRGSALVCPDPDGAARAYPGRDCQPDGGRETLSMRMAEVLGVQSDDRGWVDFSIGAPLRYIPASLLREPDRHPELRSQLEGRVVLVGPILDFEDRLLLPAALSAWEPGGLVQPGVVFQAQALRSLRHGLLAPAPWWWMALAIAAGAAFFFGEHVRRKLALLAVFAAALAALSLGLLKGGTWLPLTAPLFCATLALSVSGIRVAWRDRKERALLRRTFTGYVSPEVLKAIMAGTISLEKGGEKRRICVLFSDIRNFTTMSETMQPDVIVRMLNDYFDRMAAIVHRHGGTVDKFIGDGMMAVFGAPQALAAPEQCAIDAAREMLSELPALNRQLEERGLPTLAFGVGLHSGQAIVGYVGSAQRHEYTAIGDTVNAAARIADLPKTIGYPIACSAVVAEALGMPDWLHDVGDRELKGRRPLRIFGCHATVDAPRPQSAPAA